jgi:hypothetical protein
MPVTTAPLLSFDARGQIGKAIVYSSWKGRSYARRHVIPANPNSADQQETRNTFSWLNNVWRMMPADIIAGWDAYADSNRFTNRNGFIKINLSALRSEADLTNFIFSPSAKGGPVGGTFTITPGNDQVQLALAAPTLPAGWTIVQANFAAIRQQDPQSGELYVVSSAVDATSAYDVTITGLASAVTYVVGAWFTFLKPDGTNAYGQAQMGTALTT